MTGKFNKYYNLTLGDFKMTDQPTIATFVNGKIFGTRFGSWEELTYGVDQKMIECKYVDNNDQIQRVGTLKLISNFVSAGYSYLNSIDEIFGYYDQEIKVRIEKSNDAERFPAIAFVGKHLIETNKVIQHSDDSNKEAS